MKGISIIIMYILEVYYLFEKVVKVFVILNWSFVKFLFKIVCGLIYRLIFYIIEFLNS